MTRVQHQQRNNGPRSLFKSSDGGDGTTSLLIFSRYEIMNPATSVGIFHCPINEYLLHDHAIETNMPKRKAIMPDPFPFSRSQRHVEFLFPSRSNLNISRCFQFIFFFHFFIFHHNLHSSVMGHLYIEEVSNWQSDQSDSLRFLKIIKDFNPSRNFSLLLQWRLGKP